MLRYFDRASLVVMLVTLVLFVAALFVGGFTHNLLLEAGVFLVSVKLIIAAYKSGVATEELKRKLEEIHSDVQRLETRKDN
jgi:CHASE3 domain sensor protein